MKVLIANPPGRFSGDRYPCPFPSRWTSLFKGYPVFIFFPYELAYLSSLLKRDLPSADVKMVDGTWLRFTVEDYIRYIEYEKPDYVVFELDTVTYGETLRIIKAIKKSTGVKTIITGQYPTVNPAKVLEDGNDYACIGEYEETVLEILQGKDPASITGLYPNSYRKVLDIDSLPDPEDDDIRRIDYSYSGGCRWTKHRSVEIHASRGCPYSCDFCVAGTVYYEKANWRFRSPGRIINEIETLRGKYPGIEGVFFDEETHIVKKAKTLELCDAIVASGNNDLHYEAMANHLLLDDEILEALKRAGYYKLRIGIETIDNETSKSIGRKSKPDRIHHVLSTAKKLGIELYGTFIIGASGSSKEGDLATVEFGKELISKGLISSWQASIAVPHPGTPFYDKAVSKGWMNTDDPEKFNGTSGTVVSYPNYSSEQIMDNVRIMSETFEKARPAESVCLVRSEAAEKTWLTEDKRGDVRESIKKLTALLDSRDNAKTIEEASGILKKYPYLMRARHILASAHEREGNFAEARRIFEEIIKDCDDYDDAINHASGAHFHLGWIKQMEGDSESALLHFKECMHLNPNHNLAKKFFWILSYPEESRVGEGEFWDDFEKSALESGKTPPWVDLSKGTRIEKFPDFWADPEIENILRGDEKTKLLERLSKPEIGNILEIGCGSGWLSLELARRGKKVTAIDVSRFRIETARKKAEEEGLEIEYIESDALDFCENSNGKKFDAVVAWDSLHHIPNLGPLMKGLQKNINEEGVFILYDHVGGSRENEEMASALLNTARLKSLPLRNGNGNGNDHIDEDLSPYEDVGSFLLEETIAQHFTILKRSSHIAFTAHVSSKIDFGKTDLALLKELKQLENSLIESNFLRGEYVYIEATKRK